MSYSIAQGKDDLSGIMHGKTVNKITNIDSAARRAARSLLAMVDPDETRQIAQLTLYDDVIDYNAPSDLKEKRVIDIRPQVNRQPSDNLGNRLSKDFDLRRESGDWYTVMDSNGTKYIRVKADLSPGANGVDPMDSATNWAASGDASSLAVDSLYSVSNGSSLKFNLANAGSSGVLTNSKISTVDLTNWVNIASFFLYVYLPSTTAITSVTLRIGSSASKYWEMTGVIHQGTAKAGWNLYRFDWANITATGVPNPSALTYARIVFAYGGTAVTGMRVDKLFASLPKIWDIEYYSKFLFRTAAGVWGETVTDDTDFINLDTATYNLFLFEWALAGLQQIQGKDAAADRGYFYKELHGDAQKQGLYKLYKMNNPSQAEKPTRNYYTNLGWRGSQGDRTQRF